jgi:hypothetical protein
MSHRLEATLWLEQPAAADNRQLAGTKKNSRTCSLTGIEDRSAAACGPQSPMK